MTTTVSVYRLNGRRDESHPCDGKYDTYQNAAQAVQIALRDPMVGRLEVVKIGDKAK
jgi:hypothetical protein